MSYCSRNVTIFNGHGDHITSGMVIDHGDHDHDHDHGDDIKNNNYYDHHGHQDHDHDDLDNGEDDPVLL